MGKGGVETKGTVLVSVVVPLVVGSAKAGPRRDVKAIGERGLQKGLLLGPGHAWRRLCKDTTGWNSGGQLD
jgi:hypothetical protein